MEEVEEEISEELPLESAGQMLCRLRKEQGMSLDDIAEKTRIPVRHLEVIDRGEYSKLPGRTYAVGFSRTYARILGLNENEVASRVRSELATIEQATPTYHESFEPGDPAKVPSRGLAWASAIAGLILMVGAGSFFAERAGIGIGPEPITSDADQIAVQQEAVAPNELLDDEAIPLSSEGQVAFTAMEDGIWVRFYDARGRRLMEKQMAVGERFEIPSDVEEPKIWTGRPDAFAITIDGRSVPKLANEETVIRDVAISAEALLARHDGAGVTTAVN